MAECGLRNEVDFVDCVQDGMQFGDEYLAELDLIEVVERHKDNYESDVEDPDDQQSDARSSSVSDDYKPASRDSDRCVCILRHPSILRMYKCTDLRSECSALLLNNHCLCNDCNLLNI